MEGSEICSLVNGQLEKIIEENKGKIPTHMIEYLNLVRIALSLIELNLTYDIY